MQDGLVRKQRTLFLAVIAEAVQDAQEPQPRVRQAAIDWLMKDQVDFPRICELAGIESTYLRHKLRLAV
jgi:hypothetical protein